MSRRDAKRSALYRAERAAWRSLPTSHPANDDLPSLDALQAYIDRVTRMATVRRRFGAHRIVAKHWPRGGNGAQAWPAGQQVEFGPRARVRWIAIHEIAHILHPRPDSKLAWAGRDSRWRQASHGREFAAIYLELVRLTLGAEAARQLRRSFVQHKVRFTKPRKVSAATRAAMIERLQRAACQGTP